MGFKRRHRPPQRASAILQQIAEVVHNPARDRFELWVAGDLVGVLGYQAETTPQGEVVTILHTVIYDEYTGHGLGSRLTRGAVEYVRDNGGQVRPVCSFTKQYLDTHPGVVRIAAA